MSGTKYFYAMGQRARSKGMTKPIAEEFYGIEKVLPYARIAFDKGYRGLAI